MEDLNYKKVASTTTDFYMSLARHLIYYCSIFAFLVGCKSVIETTPPDWSIEQVPTGVSITSEVLFEFNEAYKFSDSAIKHMQLMGRKFESDRMGIVILVGHTAPNEYAPPWLGVERAESVKKQLIRSGVEPNRIYTESLGANKLRPNDALVSNMQSVGITMVGKR